VGTYDITATLSDPGNKLGNYNVTNTKGTLTVTKADLTVKADDKSKTYGDANPAFTGTLTGVKNNDAITDSYGTTATQGSPVGTYNIVPSLSDPNNKLTNYDVTKTNGTLTIGKAALTVTADNKSKTYGDANPSLTPSYTGWKNADTASVLTGSPDLSTTATQGSNVGTYDITAAQGRSLPTTTASRSPRAR
jgi:hypothetical protein